MTYLDYILLFQERDSEQLFSDGATRLYLKLLDTASGKQWPDQFSKSDPWLANVCGCAINSLKVRRAELVQRGLLQFEPGGTGRAAAGGYRLLPQAGKEAGGE